MGKRSSEINVAYVPVEKMLDKTDYSIYKLVVLAAKRALEIASGSPRLIEIDSMMKPSTVALYEIAAGKVTYKKAKN